MSEDSYKVEMPPPCLGCGGHHGGPTSEINCLRTALLNRSVQCARHILERDTALRALAAAEKLRTEIQALPAAWPPDRK